MRITKPCTLPSDEVYFAPPAIHSCTIRRSASLSLLREGGILLVAMLSHSKLRAGSPGLMLLPLSPPARMAGILRRSSPPLILPPPWQEMHLLWKIGLMSLAKVRVTTFAAGDCGGEGAGGGGAAAGVGRTTGELTGGGKTLVSSTFFGGAVSATTVAAFSFGFAEAARLKILLPGPRKKNQPPVMQTNTTRNSRTGSSQPDAVCGLRGSAGCGSVGVSSSGMGR